MSYWTYMNGVIEVRSPRSVYEQKTLEQYIEWAISKIREVADITGSERNVVISHSLLQHNGWIGDGPFSRDEFCNATLTLTGKFRDRQFNTTYEETKKFLSELKKYFDLEQVNVNVWADYEGPRKFITSMPLNEPNAEVEYFNAQGVNWEENNDPILKLHNTNWNEFKRVFCTKERMVHAIELLNMMNFDTLEAVLNSHPLDRKIMWDYDDDYVKWLYENGEEIPKFGEEYMEALKAAVAKDKEEQND